MEMRATTKDRASVLVRGLPSTNLTSPNVRVRQVANESRALDTAALFRPSSTRMDAAHIDREIDNETDSKLEQAALRCVHLRNRVGWVMTLTAPSTAAAPGGPPLLCGPTYLWVCSGPGGPVVLFPGTICDKILFERQSGLTCVPYGG